ncbi:MAG: hypothetical protein ACP5OG_02345 [Candidatus Nanoarchaeia archaeon]
MAKLNLNTLNKKYKTINLPKDILSWALEIENCNKSDKQIFNFLTEFKDFLYFFYNCEKYSSLELPAFNKCLNLAKTKSQLMQFFYAAHSKGNPEFTNIILNKWLSIAKNSNDVNWVIANSPYASEIQKKAVLKYIELYKKE